jgi:uncharacterized protein
MTAGEIIAALGLEPHPEGGYFAETFRDRVGDERGRAASTAIYYLLKADEVSHWHRVDAAEVWHFYAGSPLEIRISADGSGTAAHTLGPEIAFGQRPQIAVPAHAWQSARSLGGWTLAGCTVAPGFEFSGFEMATAGWQPG